MPTPNRHQVRLALPALLSAAALASGCSKGGGSYVYVEPPVYQSIAEQEPNDTFLTPQGIGPVYAGDLFTIYGHSDFFDTDGFAFVAAQDIEVRVRLDGDNVFSDLELCVFDPFTGTYTLCLESPDSDEVGSFTVSAGYEFHLVVSSDFGGSLYDLDIEIYHAYGLVPFSAEAEDDTAPKALPLELSAEALKLQHQRAISRAAFQRYLGLEGPTTPARADDDAADARLPEALPFFVPGLPPLLALQRD